MLLFLFPLVLSCQQIVFVTGEYVDKTQVRSCVQLFLAALLQIQVSQYSTFRQPAASVAIALLSLVSPGASRSDYSHGSMQQRG